MVMSGGNRFAGLPDERPWDASDDEEEAGQDLRRDPGKEQGRDDSDEAPDDSDEAPGAWLEVHRRAVAEDDKRKKKKNRPAASRSADDDSNDMPEERDLQEHDRSAATERRPREQRGGAIGSETVLSAPEDLRRWKITNENDKPFKHSEPVRPGVHGDGDTQRNQESWADEVGDIDAQKRFDEYAAEDKAYPSVTELDDSALATDWWKHMKPRLVYKVNAETYTMTETNFEVTGRDCGMQLTHIENTVNYLFEWYTHYETLRLRQQSWGGGTPRDYLRDIMFFWFLPDADQLNNKPANCMRNFLDRCLYTGDKRTREETSMYEFTKSALDTMFFYMFVQSDSEKANKLKIKTKLREVTCATFSAYIIRRDDKSKQRQYPKFDYWWMHLIRTMKPRERFENVYALDEHSRADDARQNVMVLQTINPDIGKRNVQVCIYSAVDHACYDPLQDEYGETWVYYQMMICLLFDYTLLDVLLLQVKYGLYKDFRRAEFFKKKEKEWVDRQENYMRWKQQENLKKKELDKQNRENRQKQREIDRDNARAFLQPFQVNANSVNGQWRTCAYRTKTDMQHFYFGKYATKQNVQQDKFCLFRALAILIDWRSSSKTRENMYNLLTAARYSVARLVSKQLDPEFYLAHYDLWRLHYASFCYENFNFMIIPGFNRIPGQRNKLEQDVLFQWTFDDVRKWVIKCVKNDKWITWVQSYDPLAVNLAFLDGGQAKFIANLEKPEADSSLTVSGRGSAYMLDLIAWALGIPFKVVTLEATAPVFTARRPEEGVWGQNAGSAESVTAVTPAETGTEEAPAETHVAEEEAAGTHVQEAPAETDVQEEAQAETHVAAEIPAEKQPNSWVIPDAFNTANEKIFGANIPFQEIAEFNYAQLPENFASGKWQIMPTLLFENYAHNQWFDALLYDTTSDRYKQERTDRESEDSVRKRRQQQVDECFKFLKQADTAFDKCCQTKSWQTLQGGNQQYSHPPYLPHMRQVLGNICFEVLKVVHNTETTLRQSAQVREIILKELCESLFCADVEQVQLPEATKEVSNMFERNLLAQQTFQTIFRYFKKIRYREFKATDVRRTAAYEVRNNLAPENALVLDERHDDSGPLPPEAAKALQLDDKYCYLTPEETHDVSKQLQNLISVFFVYFRDLEANQPPEHLQKFVRRMLWLTKTPDLKRLYGENFTEETQIAQKNFCLDFILGQKLIHLYDNIDVTKVKDIEDALKPFEKELGPRARPTRQDATARTQEDTQAPAAETAQQETSGAVQRSRQIFPSWRNAVVGDITNEETLNGEPDTRQQPQDTGRQRQNTGRMQHDRRQTHDRREQPREDWRRHAQERESNEAQKREQEEHKLHLKEMALAERAKRKKQAALKAATAIPELRTLLEKIMDALLHKTQETTASRTYAQITQNTERYIQVAKLLYKWVFSLPDVAHDNMWIMKMSEWLPKQRETQCILRTQTAKYDILRDLVTDISASILEQLYRDKNYTPCNRFLSKILREEDTEEPLRREIQELKTDMLAPLEYAKQRCELGFNFRLYQPMAYLVQHLLHDTKRASFVKEMTEREFWGPAKIRNDFELEDSQDHGTNNGEVPIALDDVDISMSPETAEHFVEPPEYTLQEDEGIYYSKQNCHTLFHAIAQVLYKHDASAGDDGGILLDDWLHKQNVREYINELRDSVTWQTLLLFPTLRHMQQAYAQDMMFYAKRKAPSPEENARLQFYYGDEMAIDCLAAYTERTIHVYDTLVDAHGIVQHGTYQLYKTHKPKNEPNNARSVYADVRLVRTWIPLNGGRVTHYNVILPIDKSVEPYKCEDTPPWEKDREMWLGQRASRQALRMFRRWFHDSPELKTMQTLHQMIDLKHNVDILFGNVWIDTNLIHLTKQVDFMANTYNTTCTLPSNTGAILQKLLQPDISFPNIATTYNLRNVIEQTASYDNSQDLMAAPSEAPAAPSQESLLQAYENIQAFPMPIIVDGDWEDENLTEVAEELGTLLQNCETKQQIYQAFTDAFIAIRNHRNTVRDQELEWLVQDYDAYNDDPDAFWHEFFTTSSKWWNVTVREFYEVFEQLEEAELEGSPAKEVDVTYTNKTTQEEETSKVRWQWRAQQHASETNTNGHEIYNLQKFELLFVDANGGERICKPYDSSAAAKWYCKFRRDSMHVLMKYMFQRYEDRGETVTKNHSEFFQATITKQDLLNFVHHEYRFPEKCFMKEAELRNDEDFKRFLKKFYPQYCKKDQIMDKKIPRIPMDVFKLRYLSAFVRAIAEFKLMETDPKDNSQSINKEKVNALNKNSKTEFLRPAAHMDINELLVPPDASANELLVPPDARANELLVPGEQSVLLSPLARGPHGCFESGLPASSVFFVSACNLLLPT